MLENVVKFAEQGLRMGIFPMINNKRHEWTACVRVGNNSKLTWIQGEEGCGMSCFKTPEAAYEALLNFCESYGKKSSK